MERSEQIALGRRLFDYMDRRTTALADDIYRNPVADYADRAQADEERAVLFRATPLCLGLSGRLPAPGDWRTFDHAGFPILSVRGRDGALRAFVNACRHRGARVADGAGSGAMRFACPYHAWTYALDGALVGRPNDDAFAACPKGESALVALPCVERDGLIWVLPDPAGRLDLDAHLGGLGPELAAYGLGRYAHYRTVEMRRRMNWKLGMDGFLESYHLAHLHPRTVSPIIHTDLGTFDSWGPHLRMAIARRNFAAMRDLPEAEWDVVARTAVVYVLFPNTVLIGQGDHVETWHFHPAGAGADECTVYFSLWTPEPALTESAKGHWDRNFDLAIATVEKEDFPVAEGMQAGFSAGAAREVVFGRNEPSLAHFHRAVRRALDAARRARGAAPAIAAE